MFTSYQVEWVHLTRSGWVTYDLFARTSRAKLAHIRANAESFNTGVDAVLSMEKWTEIYAGGVAVGEYKIVPFSIRDYLWVSTVVRWPSSSAAIVVRNGPLFNEETNSMAEWAAITERALSSTFHVLRNP